MKKLLVLGVVAAFAAIMVMACMTTASAAEVKATVTGKIWVSSNMATIKIVEAKTEDGKVIAELKDKLLRIVGAKANDAVRLAGKEVEIKGTIRENIELDATTITVKTPPAK